MDNKNKPDPNKLIDVLGIGEAVKSVFSFFEKVIDKLPFQRLSAYQTQFLLIFIVVNLMSFVGFLLDKINAIAFYIMLLLDVVVAWFSFLLIKLKK